MGKTPGKTKERMLYKKRWRETDRLRKRHNNFVVEYIRIKFGNIYNEANSFFNGLNSIYSEKLDLRRTKEFKKWKESIINPESPEPLIISQTLQTDVTYDETTTSNNYAENPNDTDSETETTGCDQQSEDESNTESDNESSTESDNESNTNDGMLLEIPLQSYLPDHGQNIQDIGPEQLDNREYEIFSDERIQEIIEELRNDPELEAIFADPQDQEDEGVALPTLEEEIELDFEDFDYRLEVELADW